MHFDADALRLAERAALNVALRAALLAYMASVDEAEIDRIDLSVSCDDGLVSIDVTECVGHQPIHGYSL